MIILYILIGLIVGGLGIYLLLRPKIKITAKANLEIQHNNDCLVIENEHLKEIKEYREKLLEETTEQYYEAGKKCHQLTEENKKLLEQQEVLQKANNTLSENQQELQLANIRLATQSDELQKSFDQLKVTQEKTAKEYYEQALTIAQTAFDTEVESLSNKLDTCRSEIQEEYATALKDAVQEFQEQILEKQQKLNYLTTQLEVKQTDVNLAVEAARRKMEIENKKDYYRICLSDDDIVEINRLREVLPYLRDKTPLNKVIYKVYYEKPLTDMIGRVVGTGVHTGIYKITNIDNQMCYVGQAVNIGR